MPLLCSKVPPPCPLWSWRHILLQIRPFLPSDKGDGHSLEYRWWQMLCTMGMTVQNEKSNRKSEIWREIEEKGNKHCPSFQRSGHRESSPAKKKKKKCLFPCVNANMNIKISVYEWNYEYEYACAKCGEIWIRTSVRMSVYKDVNMYWRYLSIF